MNVLLSFSPRNGEVILKGCSVEHYAFSAEFQSPQWGSNSKVRSLQYEDYKFQFQSPQWGSNSKDLAYENEQITDEFQSTPSGSNSKDELRDRIVQQLGFSPRNGEVILKILKFSCQIILMKFQSPQWGSNSKV